MVPLSLFSFSVIVEPVTRILLATEICFRLFHFAHTLFVSVMYISEGFGEGLRVLNQVALFAIIEVPNK